MFERNLLVPRNVESRKEKQLQMIYRQLQQEIIDGDLMIENIPITNLGNVKKIHGRLDLYENKTLKSLGNLEYVSNTINLTDTNIEDLGNLKVVDMIILTQNKNLKSLGSIEYAKTSVILNNTNVEDLGNLKVVDWTLRLNENKTLKSLGNLEQVGGHLILNDTNIEDLGNLKVLGSLWLSKDTKVPKEQYEEFNYEIF